MRFWFAATMLRITIHQDDARCRLKLSGILAGPWVAETENVWRSPPCSGKEIELDMREVTGIDAAGHALLADMHQAGARFVVEGVWMAALIEEIIDEQLFSSASEREEQLRRDEDYRIIRDRK